MWQTPWLVFEGQESGALWAGWASLDLMSLCNIPSPCPGKGRGRQVIAVARTADVVIMMLDATKGEVQRSAGWG